MAQFDANKVVEGGKLAVRMLRRYGSGGTAPVGSGRLLHCLAKGPVSLVIFLLDVAAIVSRIQRFGACENRTK
jgi:hypothetical protein